MERIAFPVYRNRYYFSSIIFPKRSKILLNYSEPPLPQILGTWEFQNIDL